MTSIADITQRILARCRAMGFALVGVCDAHPTEREHEVREWLAAGRHGEMDYLARNLELRLDPTKLLPGAKSIICVADRYASTEVRPTHPLTPSLKGGGHAIGRVARYAWGKDYHKVMRKRLRKLCGELSHEFPHNAFRACVDTAPVLEREYAQRAGVGAIGKNTMLIERSVGSWLLLGEIITTLPLAVSRPSDPDPCGTCTRCIDACPTRAIASEGWELDATRCISYLTIEHRSSIDEQFHEAMGDWLFGCDICQEVCPHNQDTARSRQASMHPAYTSAPQRESFDLLDVLNWDEEARRQALLNSAMKRARLDMLKRNALIVTGNVLRAGTDKPALMERIAEIAAANNESEVVRDTANVVRRQLLATTHVS